MGSMTDIPRGGAAIAAGLASSEAGEQRSASIALTAEIPQAMPVLVFRIDSSGKFAELLGAAQWRFGLGDDELLGQEAAAVFPQIRLPIERALAGESQKFDFKGTTGDKPWAFDAMLTFDHARGSGAIGFAVDVTRHQRAEQRVEKHRSELAHIDRVRSVEQMASGIAHELNQPLTAIVVTADVAASKLKLGKQQTCSQMIDSLSQISEQAYKAGCIIQRIKEFVKKTEPRHSNVDMVLAICEVLSLLENELRLKRINLTTNVDAGLPKILADPIQVQQLLLNLIRNAIDAVDGETTVAAIATDNEDSRLNEDQPREIAIRARLHRDMLETSVRDSGCGIGEEQAKQCFETFYTTKIEGMGMGLAICRTIVEAHGGHIWCEPNDRRGTTFTFTMPVPGEEES